MIHLTLELPPSPNALPRNHMARHRQKNEYRRTVWMQALEQTRPFRDPPAHVEVSPIFFVYNKRDEDNLAASLKWVLDALKQDQRGKLDWRQGVADRCGYFVDDDPKHLTLGKLRQSIDRDRPRLELILGYTETEDAA